jgi:hypothetical protein
MTKLAIIDLDGVVVDADARFAKAEEAKLAYIERASNDLYAADVREATNVYWRTVFTPELVSLDTLLPGTNEHLLDIQDSGYKVIFMTSRPQSMRDATVDWLFEHTVYDADDELVMKPSAFQYTKTTVWKAGMVQMLTDFYHAEQILVVDDEQSNLDEIIRQPLIPPQVPLLIVAKSLAEAVAKLNGTWVELDPFLPPE